MGDGCLENVATLLIIGGAIALITCGVGIAKPNFHGAKFEPGLCTVTSAEAELAFYDLPTCSCGKSCKEEFPCIRVYGTFASNTTQTAWKIGTFHSDYAALTTGCLTTPSDCGRLFDDNANQIYTWFLRFLTPKVDYDRRYPDMWGVNATFINYTTPAVECWGKDNDMYFEMMYSYKKGVISVCVPAGVVLLGFAVGLFSEADGIEVIFALLLCPFFLVKWLFKKCTKCIRRNCCVNNTVTPQDRETVSRRGHRTRAGSIPLDVEEAIRRGSLRLERMDSIEFSLGPRYFEPQQRPASPPILRLSSAPPRPGRTDDPPPYTNTQTTDLQQPPSYEDAIRLSHL